MRSKKRQLQLLAAKNAGAATSILEKLADDPALPGQLKDDILGQVGRFHQWKDDNDAGLITKEVANVELTRIKAGLRGLINRLPDDLDLPPINLNDVSEDVVPQVPEMSRKRQLQLIGLEIAIGLLGELMPDEFKNTIKDFSKGIGYTYLWLGVTAATILYFMWLSTSKERKKQKTLPVTVSAEEWQNIRTSIQKRYEKRFEQKMDERIQLSMTLSYAQEGFDQPYIDRHFAEEARTTAEIRKNLLEVFEQHGNLLIIGNPGAGKTTLLLDLAISLLDDSDGTPDAPIPLIINLAPWTEKDEDFAAWVVKSMISAYGFSEQAATTMLDKNRIIPFFDGFDEVAKDEETEDKKDQIRSACISAITTFLSVKRVPRIVICSRRDEYRRAKGNMPVSAEILVNPLTVEMVKTALQAVLDKNNLSADRTPATNIMHLIDENWALQQTLLTPFYFKLAEVVFDEKKLYDDLPTEEKELQAYLKERYVEEKLAHTQPALFSPDKTRHYLTWLARNMNERSVVSFELADLQPFMLRNWRLYQLIMGIFVCMFVSIVAFLVLNWVLDWDNGLYICLYIGLISGLGLSLIASNNIKIEDKIRLKFIFLKHWQFFKNIIVDNLTTGVYMGLGLGLSLSFDMGLGSSFGFGLVGGMVGGLVFGLISIISEITYYKEVFSPYYRLKSGFFNNFLISLTTITFAFLGGIYFLEKGDRFFYFVYFISYSFVFILFSPLFQHFYLRIAFYLEGSQPLRYVTFLEYATRCRILEQDGGHWRFRHQILQDFFSDE